jgi:hypothetical protein
MAIESSATKARLSGKMQAISDSAIKRSREKVRND